MLFGAVLGNIGMINCLRYPIASFSASIFYLGEPAFSILIIRHTKIIDVDIKYGVSSNVLEINAVHPGDEQ